MVKFILFPQFGDDVGQYVTVVDVTGGVLGDHCLVMLTLTLVFKFPPIVEVTFLNKIHSGFA